MNNKLYAVFLESGFQTAAPQFTEELRKIGQAYQGHGYWLISTTQRPDQIQSQLKGLSGDWNVEVFPIMHNVVESGIVSSATRQFLTQNARIAA